MCQYLITTDNDNDESKNNDRKHLKKSGHKVTHIQIQHQTAVSTELFSFMDLKSK